MRRKKNEKRVIPRSWFECKCRHRFRSVKATKRKRRRCPECGSQVYDGQVVESKPTGRPISNCWRLRANSPV